MFNQHNSSQPRKYSVFCSADAMENIYYIHSFLSKTFKLFCVFRFMTVNSRRWEYIKWEKLSNFGVQNMICIPNIICISDATDHSLNETFLVIIFENSFFHFPTLSHQFWVILPPKCLSYVSFSIPLSLT